VDDRGNKQDCTPLMEGSIEFCVFGVICFFFCFVYSACNAGHLDIVELLMKYKANVNIQSTSGNTALHYAAGGVGQ